MEHRIIQQNEECLYNKNTEKFTIPPLKRKLKSHIRNNKMHILPFYNDFIRSVPQNADCLEIMAEYFVKQNAKYQEFLINYTNFMNQNKQKDVKLNLELKEKSIEINNPDFDIEKAFCVNKKRKTNKKTIPANKEQEIFINENDIRYPKIDWDLENAEKKVEDEKIESKGYSETLSKSEENYDNNQEIKLRIEENEEIWKNSEVEIVPLEIQPQNLEEKFPYVPPTFAQIFNI